MRPDSLAVLAASIAAAVFPAVPALHAHRPWAWGVLAGALALRAAGLRGRGARALAVPVLVPLALALAAFAAGPVGSGVGLLAAFLAVAGLRERPTPAAP